MKSEQVHSAEPPMQLAEIEKRRDYRVCKDSHDPRGWLVRTADDRDLGKIVDLIIDEVGLNVRYLVCEAIGGRRVLLPVGFARLDARTRVVHLDFITRHDVQRLPNYRGLPISREQEIELETALTLRDPPGRESMIVRRDSITAD